MAVPQELREPVQLSEVYLFLHLPGEPERRRFLAAAAGEVRAALDRLRPDRIEGLPRLAGAPPEEIEHLRERVAKPYSKLEAVAAANQELVARREAAAARGDRPLADRLFREAVVAVWRAGKHVHEVQRTLVEDARAGLGEAHLAGGAVLRLVAQTGHRRAIRALSFAPGGRWLVTASDDGRVLSWDAATGRELCTWWPRDAELHGALRAVALSADGKDLVVEDDRGWLLRWGPDGSGRPWPGSLAAELPGAPAPLDLAGLASAPPEVRVAVERAEKLAGEPVRAAAVSPSGALVAAGTESGALIAVDSATGEIAWSVPAMRLAVAHMAWSTDGRLSVTCEDGSRHDWDLTAGRLAPASGAASAAGGRAFTIEPISPPGPYTGQILRDRATGEIAGYVDVRKGNEVIDIALSCAGDRVLVLHADGSAGLGALGGEAGWLSEPRYAWLARLRHATAVALSPAARFAAAGREDGVIQIWDPSAGPHEQRLCLAIAFPDGRWAASDDEGRFDASNGGAESGLHWVLDAEPILLEQLKERYYDPFLLAKKLGLHPEPPRRVDPLDPKLAPSVSIVPGEPAGGAAGASRIRVVVTDRGGGIGPVSVAINGKEAFVCRIDGGSVAIDCRVPFGGWTSSSVAPGPGGALEMTCHFDLAGHPYLRAGERAPAGHSTHPGVRRPGPRDDIRVIAMDGGGTLSSREVRRTLPQRPAPPAPAPHLWAIVAGVAAYAGERLRLRYSAKDAEDFGAALSVGAAALFGHDRVHIRVLSTDRGAAEEQPTRANIAAAFEAARGAAAGDVLVMYLAGHGAQHREGADDDFYFLTAEARRGDLSDPVARSQEAISSEDLTAWIHLVPALKQVMILDACHSGQMAADLVEARALPSSQVRALERMKDRTGLFVLAGAEAGAASLEASRYAQGLLTHALLFGMRGPALRDGDLVDVQRLAAFAIDEVPRLAEGVGAVQRPVLAAPRAASSFDIGLIAAEARARIPLSEPLPVLRRADFQERGAMEDTLGLGEAIDAALADRSAGARGAPFVLTSGRVFPGAHRLLGSYSIREDRVTVTVRLVSGARRLLDDRRLKGTTAAPEALARRIADMVVAVLKGAPT